MPLKIAVCDDERAVCDDISRRIKNIFLNKNIDCSCDCFNNGEELCDEMAGGNYDIILLDIELPAMNGVSVGNYIRDVLHNEIVQIAYISSHEGYSMQLFDSRPINFLIKPVSDETLQRLAEKYLVVAHTAAEYFVFRSDRKYIRLPLSDIMYFTSSGKKAIAVSKDKSYVFYDTLTHVREQIESESFFFVHKSFLINYRYIRNYKFTEITMTDGTVIPVSRSHQSSARSAFLNMK